MSVSRTPMAVSDQASVGTLWATSHEFENATARGYAMITESCSLAEDNPKDVAAPIVLVVASTGCPKQKPRHGVAMQQNSRGRQLLPRQPRPPPLVLSRSFGSSGLKSAELRQQICDASSAVSHPVTQTVVDEREASTPTPSPPNTVVEMGNQPSAHPSEFVSDNVSAKSVVCRTVKQPLPRKGSYNIFKRVDSKLPLSRDLTPSVISTRHFENHRKKEFATTGPTRASAEWTDLNDDHAQDHVGRESGAEEARPRFRPSSAATATRERNGLPLSSERTVRNSQASSDDPRSLNCAVPLHCAPNTAAPVEHEAFPALSPTIPAPSPLPEDSPHKYGLRDEADTLEVSESGPMEINVHRMRRKSSGFEIFNEAKSLQSAQSFLNGLSTSRRRAESVAVVRSTHDLPLSAATSEGDGQSSTKPPSIRVKPLPRQRGHNFKTSGFAYSRPLNLAQIKCYRGHSRLIPSGNKCAPVECAVCHIDDEDEHFSCSWCALRMCRLCRRDFDERGINALRERIRKAELGGAMDFADSSSGSGSSHELRRVKSSTFT